MYCGRLREKVVVSFVVKRAGKIIRIAGRTKLADGQSGTFKVCSVVFRGTGRGRIESFGDIINVGVGSGRQSCV